MKIAVLVSSYPRFKGDGVAPFVKSISEALHQRGHHVEILAPYDIAVESDAEAEIKVHRFKYILPENLHILGHARSLQADVKLRPLVPLILPFFILASVIHLVRLVKHMQAEVIHAHWVLPNGLSAAVVSKMLNIPFVISLHGSDIFMADKNPVFRSAAKWVFSAASHVTACSQELYERAKKINPDIKIDLLAWGADPNVFKPLEQKAEIREKYGWQQEDLIVTTLGRFVYKKGFNRLISIVPELILHRSNLRVVIGGSGPLEQELKNQVRDLELDDTVCFPGQILWHQVPEFLAASDIFVLPSQRDSAGNLDGLPTVLLEAMACGLPCVASDVGGVNLVIKHGQNGFLTDPESCETLKEALVALLNNEKLQSSFSKQSRLSVVNHFNWNRVAEHFEGIFNTIK